MKGVDVMDCRVEVVDLIDIVREEVGKFFTIWGGGN